MAGKASTGTAKAARVERALRVRRGGKKKAAAAANMMEVLITSGRVGAIEILCEATIASKQEATIH